MKIRLDVARAGGIAVVAPGAADVAGALGQAEVAKAFARQGESARRSSR